MADSNSFTQFSQLVDDFQNMYDIATEIIFSEEYKNVTIEDGTLRPTWYKYARDRFNELAQNTGYEYLGDYAAGIALTEYNQVVRDTNGEFWKLDGSVAVPYTTTGAGLPEGGNFVAVGDASLRSEFNAYKLEVQSDFDDVGSRIDDLEQESIKVIQDVATLRTTDGAFEGQAVKVKSYLQDGPGKPFDAYWTTNTGLTDDGVGTFTAPNGAWLAPTENRISAFRGGVTGDGVTDESPAFQRCFDYLSSQGGGEVYMPAGYTYAIRPFGTDCCFNVWSNCSLIGNGSSSPFVIPADTVSSSYIFLPIRIGDGSTGADNVTIKDIYINCNQEAIFGIRGAATGFMFAIGARHEVDLTASSSDVTIEGCTVRDSNIGISCSKNGSDGLFYQQSRRDSVFRRWTATRNHISKTNNKAIEFQEATNCSIDNNTGEQLWDGPQFIFGCSNSRIVNNTMSYILTGINVTHGANGILVDGNNMTAEGTGGDGKAAMILRVEPIVAGASINAIENVIISNNRFVDNLSLATRAFMMETRTQTTSAAFRNVSFIGNIFDGNVYLYDFGGNTNSTFSDALLEGNQFRRTVFTVDTQPVTRINFIGNRVENNLNWRIDGGFISGNRFVNGFNFDSRGTGNQYVANNIATPTGDVTNNTVR